VPWHQAPDTLPLVPGAWCQALGVSCQMPGTWCQVPRTWCQKPGTWHQAPGACYWIPGVLWQHLRVGSGHIAHTNCDQEFYTGSGEVMLFWWK